MPTSWHVDATRPGFTHPDQPTRCPDCTWTEVRTLGQPHPDHVLVTPCKEHR